MKSLGNIKNNYTIKTAFCFGVASLLLNLLSVLILDSAHIYDIIHAIPTALLYGPIVEMMGGIVPTPLIFIPLAVILDIIMGALVGIGLTKWLKKDTYKKIGIWVSFAIYWIMITFQWLPII